MEKAELKKLLLESTEKLIAQLSEILDKNSGLYNEMIILSKKYYEGKMEINLGTIKFEDWNILKTQVDVGLLDLIDRIQKPLEHSSNQISKQKKILVEDTIRWLSNILLAQERSSEEKEKEDDEKTITKMSFKIEKVNIDSEGDFDITSIERYNAMTYSHKEWMFTYDNFERKKISGNLRDIGKAEIIKYRNKDCYNIRLTSPNGQTCFLLKIEEKKESYGPSYRQKPSQKIEIKNIESFHIGEEMDLKSAEGVKNAIDYLAIHFGRKEDAF